MTVDEAKSRYGKLLRLLGEGASASAALDDLQHAMQQELFGGRPVLGEHYDVRQDDARAEILVDALQALSLGEPDDPSYPWDLALILSVLGRHREAAAAHLEAADRFAAAAEIEADARSADDEADWAATAVYLAAKSFLAGGRPASAASLLSRLVGEDRSEITAGLVTATTG